LYSLVMLSQLPEAWCTYSHFEGQLVAAVLSCQGVENGGKLLGVELDWNEMSAPIMLMRSVMALIELRRDVAEKVFNRHQVRQILFQ
jgi:hypothetical protein